MNRDNKDFLEKHELCIELHAEKSIAQRKYQDQAREGCEIRVLMPKITKDEVGGLHGL